MCNILCEASISFFCLFIKEVLMKVPKETACKQATKDILNVVMSQ